MDTFSVDFASDLMNYIAVVTRMDDGLVLAVGGGHTHVGTVILAEPRESLKKDGTYSSTSSVINPVGHLDEVPLRREAERLAADLRIRVCLAGGIHLDNISPEEISQVQSDCRTLFRLIREKL